ncbi:type IV pilus assembly protein PilW [Pseudomonas sp. ok272]|uniref:PilW family protein n=1 Tax=unclassified Pseudomonas TaxID=196821 RepID=UPI0008B371AC|nr:MULTISPECIES: prepilin-type N-terminal cleavage/methylation domain-containing protein [unclassified Pseudomonas]SEM92766.1 type IV pilus assembly protein PilW [Pseudomonas sp. ok272]SFM95498.1 type IV pilus assembly protein PilW [Pseudomonas sp. ok602]
MSRCQRGFTLIELMLALAISLSVVVGMVQVFIAAKSTYVSQRLAAGMQEDARFVLGKLLQEIRMVGMFGCLRVVTDASSAGDFTASHLAPIRWDQQARKLTLVTADVGNPGTAPTWTVVTDCQTTATAYTGSRAPAVGQWGFAIRRLAYRFNNGQILRVSDNGATTAVLVDNVSAFEVSFGLAVGASDNAVSRYSSNPVDPAHIRSVRLGLTLSDPQGRVRDQTYSLVAALRNRLL